MAQRGRVVAIILQSMVIGAAGIGGAAADDKAVGGAQCTNRTPVQIGRQRPLLCEAPDGARPRLYLFEMAQGKIAGASRKQSLLRSAGGYRTLVQETSGPPHVPTEVSPIDAMAAPQGLPGAPEPLAALDEQQTRSAFAALLKKLFISYATTGRDLDRLEEIATRLREGRERTPSGVWKLAALYDTLGYYKATNLYLPGGPPSFFDEAIKKWIARYPKSPTPRIIQAEFYRRDALAAASPMAARYGAGPGSDTHKAALELARTYLLSTKDIASRDPAWFAEMIAIRADQHAPVDEIMALVREAAALEPDYHETYFSAVRAIANVSTDPARDLETLAATAASLAKSGEGIEHYARIYWVIISGIAGLDGMQHLSIDWDKMVISMEAVAKRYPDQWNIQHFALFSCVAGDAREFAKFRAEMPALPNFVVWQGPETFKECTKWAQEYAGAEARSKKN